MGIVTDTLIKLIQRQVDERGIVVWFDPTGTYASVVAGLHIDEIRVVSFNGSFLSLRREVDDLMNDVQSDQPPRLIIYVPKDASAIGDILGEFTYAGAVMKPGGQPLPQNTDLESVARRALKSVFTPEQIDGVCEQVANGQITTIAELDELAEKSAQFSTGAIVLIFDTGLPSEVALKFLTDTQFDKQLTARRAIPELAALLSEAFEAQLPTDEKADALRARLRKHVLLTEFGESLDGDLPPALSTVKRPEEANARAACVQVARTWRNRRDLQRSYIDAADRTEKDYGLSNLTFDWSALRHVHTFRFVEEQLQKGVEQSLTQHVLPEWIDLATDRQARFWAEVNPDILARWTLVATAGQVLGEAKRGAAALKSNTALTAIDLIEQYTSPTEPWCQLDTHHRALERLCQNYDLDAHGRHNTLEQLLARARQQYTRVLDELARRFVTALQAAQFTLGGALYQTEVYSRYVTPALASGKTAYILVDALRYEMARDLANSLNKDWRVELLPAIGTAPTITEVGMAALLPGAERGTALVGVGGGKLALEFGGRFFKDRKDRIKFLREQIDDFYETKLEALTPANRSTRDEIKKARFIVVTSREIDDLGEGENMSQAREFMDTALLKLSRAFRLLADLGVQHIVVAADHGYIFGEELADDLTLPAPGGHTVDLHRRVWVGKGGQATSDVVRVSTQTLNLGGDLEVATPIGLACFKAGGNKSYMHGGLSLQELIIPVLHIEPGIVPAVVAAPIEWTLKPGTRKITTRFYSVQVMGQATGMFEMVPPRVRLEVRAKSKTLSVPVAATYGYQEATGEVELQRKADAPNEIEPNTIMIMINGETEQKTVSVVLIDAATDKALQSLDKVEFAISI